MPSATQPRMRMVNRGASMADVIRTPPTAGDNPVIGTSGDDSPTIIDNRAGSIVVDGLANRGDGSRPGVAPIQNTVPPGGADLIRTGRRSDTNRTGGGNGSNGSGSGIGDADGAAGIDIRSADRGAAKACLAVDLGAGSTCLGTGRVRTVEGPGTCATGARTDAVGGHRAAAQNGRTDSGGSDDTVRGGGP